MGIDNNYLFILFSNLSHLFSVNLVHYKMHRVEEEYLTDALDFFMEVKSNIESYASSKEFNTINLVSLNAIPNLYRVYENNESSFKSLLPENQKTREEFFKLIYNTILTYKTQKTLDKKLKMLLAKYFFELACNFEKTTSFEKLDRISNSPSKRSMNAAFA